MQSFLSLDLYLFSARAQSTLSFVFFDAFALPLPTRHRHSDAPFIGLARSPAFRFVLIDSSAFHLHIQKNIQALSLIHWLSPANEALISRLAMAAHATRRLMGAGQLVDLQRRPEAALH